VGQSRRGSQVVFGELEDCLLPNSKRGVEFKKSYSVQQNPSR
jgi:hypothetical protein